MYFKEWVTTKYIKKNSIYGDFARDTQRAESFPDTKDFESIKDYLIISLACSESIKAFKALYKKYRVRPTNEI